MEKGSVIPFDQYTYRFFDSCSRQTATDSHMCSVVVRLVVDRIRRSDMADLDHNTYRRPYAVLSVD